jgi:hypothetical protein
MTPTELRTHTLLRRLIYLLARIEAEFFHVHPDIKTNGNVISLALTSILNESVNLIEHAIDPPFFPTLRSWSEGQEWSWNDIEIRFTWWPVCEAVRPFSVNAKDEIAIAGRDANNNVKHTGSLASLKDTLGSCAAAWFIVLERAREARVFLGDDEVSLLFRIFDCYHLLTSMSAGYGTKICRPVVNMLAYPTIRGESEVGVAKEAYNTRLTRVQGKTG